MLLTGFVLSLAVHGAVLLPWLGDEADAGTSEGIADLSRELAPPPPEEEETPLGLEESLAKTMNWIGYEEYEEHLARLAETDQAAFTRNRSGGGGAPPPTATTPETTPANTAAPVQGGGAPPSVAAPATESTGDQRTPEAPTPVEAETVERTAVEEPKPDTEDSLVGPPRPEPQDAPDPAPEPAPEPKPETAPPAEPQPQPQPSPTPEPAPTPAPQPGPAEGPGDGEDEPDVGDASDRESDATSVIEVPREVWRAGRPLAARGLELQTVRPVLTELTQLTARFGNPLVEIRFGRNGRPRSATIIESSGDRRVDEPILDSLYRWRARGARLGELEGEATEDVRLRIILY